jgi:anti-sigma B factor antagonist
MPEATLDCYTRPDGRRTILVLEGTLDVATAPAAAEALARFTKEHGPEVIVDTSRVDFIDSRGVGALIGAAKAARDAGGAVYLPAPAVPVRKILEICGVTALFPAVPPPPPAPAPAAAAAPASGSPARPSAPARSGARTARKTA